MRIDIGVARGGVQGVCTPPDNCTLRGLEYQANLHSLRVLDPSVACIVHQNVHFQTKKNIFPIGDFDYAPSQKIFEFFSDPLLTLQTRK